MSIDVHTYIGHYPYRHLRGNTPKGLISYMDRFSIERAAVANLDAIFYRNPQPGNEELAAAIQPFPGRFIPFAVINPTYGGWKEDFEACRKLGMKGLRLYPQYHDYNLSDPRLRELLEAADGLHMPVAFTRWLEDTRQKSWLDAGQEFRLDDLLPVLRDNPGTFLFLNANLGPIKDEYLRAIREARIHFDTTWATTTIDVWSGYEIVNWVKDLGPERFLFGSGYPFRDPVTPLIRLSIASELDQKTREAIWDGNARRIFNL
jgi:hypothetical protein